MKTLKLENGREIAIIRIINQVKTEELGKKPVAHLVKYSGTRGVISLCACCIHSKAEQQDIARQLIALGIRECMMPCAGSWGDCGKDDAETQDLVKQVVAVRDLEEQGGVCEEMLELLWVTGQEE